MLEAFHFQVGWRTYRCHVERQPGSGNDAWWWFVVTGDGHRHAPFRVVARESQESVRARILAYHSNHVARREAPPVPRNQGRPPRINPPPPSPK